MKTKRKFKRGDKVRILSGGDLETVIHSVEWSDSINNWKYWFKDVDDQLWFEIDTTIELISNSNTVYDIDTDDNGKRFRATFEWYDTKDKYHIVETQDIDEAQIIMSLLSGESCLADYEADKNI